MRNGIQYAQVTSKKCPMYEPACAAKIAEQVAAFYPRSANGTEIDAMALIEEHCGRYTRGKHAGQLRGWAEVRVVTEGGWMKDGPGYRNGRAVYPGTVLSVTITDFNGKTYLSVSGR